MKLRNLVLLAPLAFLLQGCWFIFIPGSVTSAISDSVTGAEGSNCVGANAKVGDNIRLTGGAQATIKSLSGTSTRCTNPEYPIRALVVLSDNKPASSSPSQITSNIRLELPTGWERRTLSEQMASGGGFLYATNRTTDSGLLLSASRRDGITDLMEFAVTRRANQANRLTDPQQSQVLQIEIKGKKALRFEVTGALKSGLKLTYMMTVIEGATEIAILNTWTTAANFENQKGAMAQLSENVVGL